MNWTFLLSSGLLAFALVAVLNTIALQPWRKAAAAHWSLRARALYPALVGQVLHVWFIPLGVVSFLRWVAPGVGANPFTGWLVALVGAILGSCFLSKEVIPWLTWRMLRNELVLGWGIFVLRLSAYALVIFNLAWRVDAYGLTLGAGVMVYDVWVARAGLVRFLHRAGYYRTAPPSLQRLVEEVCARLQVPVPTVWTVDSSHCNAFALVLAHALIFTNVLVERLTPEELKSVIAHELAHLGESRAARYGRLLGLLGAWPFLFVGPIVQQYGAFSLVVLAVWRFVLAKILAHFGRRMEVRADQQAASLESQDEPVYARALARIYEVGQMPVVLSGKGTSHPHLYDRMLAAGVEPDFPRPSAPNQVDPFTFVIYSAAVFLILSQRDLFREIFLLILGR